MCKYWAFIHLTSAGNLCKLVFRTWKAGLWISSLPKSRRKIEMGNFLPNNVHKISDVWGKTFPTSTAYLYCRAPLSVSSDRYGGASSWLADVHLFRKISRLAIYLCLGIPWKHGIATLVVLDIGISLVITGVAFLSAVVQQNVCVIITKRSLNYGTQAVSET